MLLTELANDLSYAIIALQTERERDRFGVERIEIEEQYRTLFETLHEGFALLEVICNGEGKPCDYRFFEVLGH